MMSLHCMLTTCNAMKMLLFRKRLQDIVGSDVFLGVLVSKNSHPVTLQPHSTTPGRTEVLVSERFNFPLLKPLPSVHICHSVGLTLQRPSFSVTWVSEAVLVFGMAATLAGFVKLALPYLCRFRHISHVREGGGGHTVKHRWLLGKGGGVGQRRRPLKHRRSIYARAPTETPQHAVPTQSKVLLRDFAPVMPLCIA